MTAPQGGTECGTDCTQLRVCGRMLFAIAALYATAKHQGKCTMANVTNGLSEESGGDAGVRQGYPLSPFLVFGVFVEMLHERILKLMSTLRRDHPLTATTQSMYCYFSQMILHCCSHIRHSGLAAVIALPCRLL
jgi:hypothetical protein